MSSSAGVASIKTPPSFNKSLGFFAQKLQGRPVGHRRGLRRHCDNHRRLDRQSGVIGRRLAIAGIGFSHPTPLP